MWFWGIAQTILSDHNLLYLIGPRYCGKMAYGHAGQIKTAENWFT